LSSPHLRWIWLDLLVVAGAWSYFVLGRHYPSRVAFACAFALGAFSFLVRRGFWQWRELYLRSREHPFEGEPPADPPSD
jgi:hypothetical protein